MCAMSGRKRSTHKRKEALGRPSASLCVCIDKWDRTPTFPPLTDTLQNYKYPGRESNS